MPVQNTEIRSGLKELLSSWQDKVKSHDHLVKFHESYWNVPEGCVSIMMEYMSGGSLQNLLESVGALPEPVLKDITVQVLLGLKHIHENLDCEHGGLTTSQILFDKNSKVKVKKCV